jgi:DNA-binding Lrp family transcriptional regulator
MDSFATVTETIKGLEERGYTENFVLQSDHLALPDRDITLYPDDFEVVKTYRYEGESDPGDATIIYAIEAKDGIKGVLVEAYGAYTDPIAPELVQKLAEHHGLSGLQNKNYRNPS